MSTGEPIVENERQLAKIWSTQGIRQEFLNRTIPQTNNILGPYFIDYGNGKPYKVIDGPPFATGLPHYGHYLAGSLKDVEVRYKTLCGYNVTKIPGWDVQGVPIEMQTNKQLDITSKADVERIGIDKYCDTCRESVLACADSWKTSMARYGRWLDFDHPYTTMDFSFGETEWRIFSLLYNNGHVDRGYRVSAYSTALETTLSSSEASSNYITRNDQSLTFRVKLNYVIKGHEDCTVWASVYTTTPWTLPGNCIMAINKNFEYVGDIQNSDITLRVKSKKDKNSKIVVKGADLLNTAYVPLFDFSKQFYGETDPKMYKIYHADFVEQDMGTGVVHCAPMFGEEDFKLCLTLGIISKNGKNMYDYLNSVGEIENSVGSYFHPNYKHTLCYKFNGQIITYIKTQKSDHYVKDQQVSHSYPHCWRTHTPLIYRAMPSWTINVSTFKDELVELNKQVTWYPDNIGKGRFHEWLKSACDWNVSRSRIWGTPMPIWQNINDSNDLIVIGSANELEDKCGLKKGSITDLHRDKIDHLVIEENEKKYKRIPEVFDCWFDSGSVPMHFSSGSFESSDFIAEGVDQTRGWFYTQMVLGYICSKYINNDPMPAYRNVMVNGLVLAADGKKMSKSLQNYTDPNILMEQYGADAMRMYLLCSPAANGEAMKFKDEGVKDVMRTTLLQYHSTVSLLNIYRKVHVDILNKGRDVLNINEMLHPLNKWIMNETYKLEKLCHTAYQNHNFRVIVTSVTDFVELLNNCHIKLMRPNIKNPTKDPTLIRTTVETLDTIAFVLLRLAHIMAPIAPFFAEYLFMETKDTFALTKNVKSIHLQQYSDFYPFFESYHRNYTVEDNVVKQLEFLENVRILRAKHDHPKCKMFQKVVCITDSFTTILDEIEKEINSANVEFIKLSEFDDRPIDYEPQMDNKKMGQKFKGDSKAIITAIKASPDAIALLFNGRQAMVRIKGNQDFVIDPNMIESWSYKMNFAGFEYLKHVLSKTGNETFQHIVGKDFIVFADMTHNKEMEERLFIQNIARKFQRMRAEANLIPSDPVSLQIFTGDHFGFLHDLLVKHHSAFKDVTNRDLLLNVAKKPYMVKEIEFEFNEQSYVLELQLS